MWWYCRWELANEKAIDGWKKSGGREYCNDLCDDKSKSSLCFDFKKILYKDVKV